ncbi:glycoside hydrolase superfamily [Sporodiniella umbellata]|nr:glycoside hydrolase superfamily [Sporodiniella umbellata]
MVDLHEQRMLANGFQSWSQARELSVNDKIQAIPSSVAWYTQMNLQGDYDFFKHTGEQGYIHSNSFTHFRDVKNVVSFFGSISEAYGYTYFLGDFNANRLSIYKDVQGMVLAAGDEVGLVRVFVAQGVSAEASLWDTYAEFYPDRRAVKDNAHVSGWTSWYNYYGDISEQIVEENLAALQKHAYPIDIFQIDDGFQTAIGDWLSINSKFPSGMKAVAANIHQAGFKAGLWLAPYAVGCQSRVAKEHPDWLITDPDSHKPVLAGPNWGGFYALDMYQPEARAYLKQVFDVVLQDWGFDMVKLDFCFAAAMLPRQGKNRGQIMWEAMELVRDLVGPNKSVLGCGVPLVSAFRKVDYCRIGSDVAPWWEDTKLKLMHVRERVSTANSLISTLNRWTLSDRMFGNDPDVMILREHKNKLTLPERHTLCVLNNVLGALVFSSDNVALYGPEEHRLYAATFPKVVPQVQSVLEFRPDCYLIQFRVKHGVRELRYTIYTNLSDQDQTLYLPPSAADTHLLSTTDLTTPGCEPSFYHPSSETKLRVHETKTFLHIPPPNGLHFLGSNAHIVPGTELDRFELLSHALHLTFRPHTTRTPIYFTLGDYLHSPHAIPPPVCQLNGQQVAHRWIPVLGFGEGRNESHVLVFVV